MQTNRYQPENCHILYGHIYSFVHAPLTLGLTIALRACNAVLSTNFHPTNLLMSTWP